MFIARWHLTAQFGRIEDGISIFKRWEVDVAQRIGWKSTRLLVGSIGGSESEIEFEVRFDSLTDLEAAFADLGKSPWHREYVKQLATLLVGGSDRWTIRREVDLTR